MRDQPRQAQDARLIAAAPNLLAACWDVDEAWHIIHDALKHIGCEEVRTHAVDLLNDLQDGARDAIAKATGETVNYDTIAKTGVTTFSDIVQTSTAGVVIAGGLTTTTVINGLTGNSQQENVCWATKAPDGKPAPIGGYITYGSSCYSESQI